MNGGIVANKFQSVIYMKGKPCTNIYALFKNEAGVEYLQIELFGSDFRETKSKQSQVLQFNKEMLGKNARHCKKPTIVNIN